MFKSVKMPICAMLLMGLFVGGASAENLQCGGFDFFRNVMLSHEHKFTYYTLQKNGRAKNTLFITHGRPIKNSGSSKADVVVPWVLFKHFPNDRHCIVGKGNTVEALMSLHTTKPSLRFGLPASGHPRCSRGTDVMETMQVRMWANRELGDSFVLHLNANIGDSFTILISNDKFWILLNTNSKNNLITCYYARGDNVNDKTIVPQKSKNK